MPNSKPRARDLGIPLEGTPGKYNAITDVEGVTVGYSTIIEGESARTGVTIIHPRGKENHDPVFGAWFPFNGNGEITGAAWMDEGGFLEGPIGITNTHSVGIVRDTIIDWQAKQEKMFQHWSCPVVTETADGNLNDMNGFFVKPHHVWEALENAESGSVEEGSVGGGTGMLCYEFKGGSGTSSRKLSEKFGGWTVGAFAQTNFGMRYQLTVAGVPVGHHLKEHPVWSDGENPWQESGSLIIVLATDAPLLPHQLKRMAKRASLGMARTGSLGGNGSGDIFIAFSTANPNTALQGDKQVVELRALDNDHLNPLFGASVFATEEAILNSLVAGEDMTGHQGFSVKGLPHEELREVLRMYGRLG
jgi:L-aminopeptidase/D-esterase-like protein